MLRSKQPCVISSSPGLDIGGFITNFVTKISKLVDDTNFSTTLPIVYYILIAATILMVLYFVIECCTGKFIPMLVFIIGPDLNNDNQEKAEQSTSRNGETGSAIEEQIFPTWMNIQKRTILLSQIVCCICVILYIIALILSPGLFNQALTSKLLICHDGLWDNTPDESLHCVGKFYNFCFDFFIVLSRH